MSAAPATTATPTLFDRAHLDHGDTLVRSAPFHFLVAHDQLPGGAAADLEHAAKIALAMLLQYGMEGNMGYAALGGLDSLRGALNWQTVGNLSGTVSALSTLEDFMLGLVLWILLLSWPAFGRSTRSPLPRRARMRHVGKPLRFAAG